MVTPVIAMLGLSVTEDTFWN